MNEGLVVVVRAIIVLYFADICKILGKEQISQLTFLIIF